MLLCFVREPTIKRAPLSHAKPNTLHPQPPTPGNHPSAHRVCFHAEDFPTTVSKDKTDSGWQWTNEGTVESPKWGYVSRAPGAVMRVHLDTSLAAVDPGAMVPSLLPSDSEGQPAGRGRQHTAVVIFSYLKSYEHMGRAEFR